MSPTTETTRPLGARRTRSLTAPGEPGLTTAATDHAQVVHLGSRCILVLVGEIDVATASNMACIAQDALADPAVIDVIIDASAVTFIDSTGVDGLLAIRKAATAQGATVRICAASDNVVKVLTTTGLRTRFAVPI